jgi:hypothetical protein
MNEVLLLARILLSYARSGLLAPLLSTSFERAAAWIAVCSEWLLR